MYYAVLFYYLFFAQFSVLFAAFERFLLANGSVNFAEQPSQQIRTPPCTLPAAPLGSLHPAPCTQPTPRTAVCGTG